MSTLALLAFVSPIFGLRLEVQPSLMQLPPLLPGDAIEAPLEPVTSEGPVASPAEAAQAEETPPAASTTSSRPILMPVDDIGAQMNRRARFARAHKRLGIATWAAMTTTVITGTLQYVNLYGVFSARDRTRCAGHGEPIFGDDACVGVPLPHVISTVVAGSLYYTTFGISFAMPDPIGLDRGNSESARALRQHKRMRWAHFGGMALQAVLGTMVANPHLIGLDRTNDYRALQTLATVHLVSGYATYGMLTYTGARMAF